MKTNKIAVAFSLDGGRTTVELEEEYWDALQDISTRQKIDVATLVERLNRRRGGDSLAAALRTFSVSYFQIGRAHV